MPAGISAADRKLLLIAGASFLLLIIVGFIFAPTGNEQKTATTYSAASEGAKAAYWLLQETGYHVERWQQSPTALQPDKHSVLIVADPAMIPDQKDKAAIERFLSGGGRIIATGLLGASFLPENSSEFDPAPKRPWSEFKALSPSPITRAAPKVTLSPVAHWTGNSAIPMYGDAQQKVVVRYAHGQGDAIWLSSATPFTNAGLKEPGNLEFLLAAIGNHDTRVLFDEYVHGYGERAAAQKRHPLMTALLLQSVVLAVAALLTFSRRSGPIRPLPAESRLAPLEFVETLGGLYQQAAAASVAVDVYYQRFHYWTARRLGLAVNASPEEIARAVRERWHFDDGLFLSTLQRAASARYRPDLPKREALKLVQSIYGYALKLHLYPAAKEKH